MAQVVFGANPRFFPQMIRAEVYSVGGVQITNQNLLIIVVAIVMMFGLEFIVHRTDRQGDATSFNLSVAKLMGINTDYVIAFTFALGSALAAVGGVMVALAIPRIDPLMGLMTGLKAFVAAVLGGIGNIPGAMIGGVLIGLLETWPQRHRLLHLPRRRGVRGAHSDPALPAGRHPGRGNGREGLGARPSHAGDDEDRDGRHGRPPARSELLFEYGFGDFRINAYYARILNLIGINITLPSA